MMNSRPLLTFAVLAGVLFVTCETLGCSAEDWICIPQDQEPVCICHGVECDCSSVVTRSWWVTGPMWIAISIMGYIIIIGIINVIDIMFCGSRFIKMVDLEIERFLSEYTIDKDDEEEEKERNRIRADELTKWPDFWGVSKPRRYGEGPDNMFISGPYPTGGSSVNAGSSAMKNRVYQSLVKTKREICK